MAAARQRVARPQAGQGADSPGLRRAGARDPRLPGPRNFSGKAGTLGNTGNIYVAGFFLSLVGVVFVSLPRYFLELQWYRYRHRVAGHTGAAPAYQDTRPFSAKLIATVLDTLLIGGFITEFWRSIIFPELSG